jgi:hypothetical protein
VLSLVFSLALQPPWSLASDSQFHDCFTDGRTPWTSNQLVARPLPKHRTTQTHNKHIHQTPMPCMGFEPMIQASERATSPCLRQIGYCGRSFSQYRLITRVQWETNARARRSNTNETSRRIFSGIHFDYELRVVSCSPHSTGMSSLLFGLLCRP